MTEPRGAVLQLTRNARHWYMTYVILVDGMFRITSKPVTSKEDLVALEGLDVDRCGKQYWKRVEDDHLATVVDLGYFFALAVHGLHENTGTCQIVQLTPSDDPDKSRWAYQVERLALVVGPSSSLSAAP